MQTMSQTDYERLIRGANVLARHVHGDKVLACENGHIIKLFRSKRLISTARLRPYGTRFIVAEKKLKARNIKTVTVVRDFYLPHLKRHAIEYEPLEGASLRESLAEALQTNGEEGLQRVMLSFMEFVALLHRRGVYFRAIHFANVLQTGDREFGLIDISEARFYRGPLRPGLRARNFKPMQRYEEDRRALEIAGRESVINCYLEHAELGKRAERRFRKGLDQHMPPTHDLSR